MTEQKRIEKKPFCFVFLNLWGKVIICYVAYAHVASEDHAWAMSMANERWKVAHLSINEKYSTTMTKLDMLESHGHLQSVTLKFGTLRPIRYFWMHLWKFTCKPPFPQRGKGVSCMFWAIGPIIMSLIVGKTLHPLICDSILKDAQGWWLSHS